MSVYKELERKCLPLLEAYHNDLLEIDRQIIEANPGVPFLHWTKKTGTHLELLFPIDSKEYPPAGVYVPYLFGSADRQHILRQRVVMAEYFAKPINSPEQYTVHYFTGKTLRLIDPLYAVKVAKEYVRPIESKWHNEWLRDHRPWEYKQLRDAGLLAS